MTFGPIKIYSHTEHDQDAEWYAGLPYREGQLKDEDVPFEVTEEFFDGNPLYEVEFRYVVTKDIKGDYKFICDSIVHDGKVFVPVPKTQNVHDLLGQNDGY